MRREILDAVGMEGIVYPNETPEELELYYEQHKEQHKGDLDQNIQFCESNLTKANTTYAAVWWNRAATGDSPHNGGQKRGIFATTGNLFDFQCKLIKMHQHYIYGTNITIQHLFKIENGKVVGEEIF